jgi:type IV pilus assembly protein PilA
LQNGDHELVHRFTFRGVCLKALRRVMKNGKKSIKLKKGFTLVEIIVVLVVLAILAAFTIPTMLGFVADAKGKAYIAEAREVYVAAQTTATEIVGTGVGLDKTNSGNNPYDDLNSYWVSRCETTGSKSYHNAASMQMKKYLGNDLKITNLDYRGNYAQDDSYWYVIMDYAVGNPGKVKEVYYAKNGYVVWFNEENVTVKKLEASASRPAVPWNK